MAYGDYEYLQLGTFIDAEKYIIAKFYVESVFPIEKAAEALAAESSVGTWTALNTMQKEIIKDKAAKVIDIDKEKKIVTIAYPNSLWEGDNIAQLLSGIAGNIYGLKEIQKLKVLDIEFNRGYVTKYEGPAFGIEGIRETLNKPTGPLLGTIIKPKLGLNEEQHAKVAYKSWLGGVDIVKDDENLTSMSFNNFYRRVAITLKMKRRAEEKTGSKKMYLPNITALPNEMYRRAQFVRENGGEAVMIDIITAGFTSVQHIRNYDLNLIIHGHRAMHGALTRDPQNGISMLILSKLARLAGIDELHIGTVIGKMEGGRSETLDMHNFLRGYWFGLKSVMHVASGGLHPGHIEALINVLGNEDVIINLGGGIHGHPDGTYAGAVAGKQAINIVHAGGHLEEALHSDKFPELKKALQKWGIHSDTPKNGLTPTEFNTELTHKNATL